jgi:haloacetate dehalogenase
MNESRREILKSGAAALSTLATSQALGAQARDLFVGFQTRHIPTSGATIHVRTAGSGPPLLLLHGFPQTNVIWHKIAPELARRFTVVAPDLRGYGFSSKPPDGENHRGYSKRVMATDQVEVMRALGFKRFAVVGHDRGGRVAWRLATEQPEHVTRAVILDIVPKPYASVTREFATAYFHWFFLIQPAPFPEQLIEAAPDAFLRRFLSRPGITPEAFAEYLRALREPGTAHGMCEDYRAGATIDEEHEAETRERRVTCPLLVLWGERSIVGTSYDPLGLWREVATDVRGRALPGGHNLPEELPEHVLSAVREFIPAGV